jgi:glyoxalase/bleomycin resistance protein/dioxygenase superfamily protein
VGRNLCGDGRLRPSAGRNPAGVDLYRDPTLVNTMTAKVTGLIPMAFAADPQRSVDFYKLLGMGVRGSLRNSSGELQWVDLVSEQAQLMLARASDPVIPSQQAVLFYLYSPDLIALREHLLASGVKVSPITYPDYMPKGEIRVEDPDGYVLLIGQAG